MQEISLEPGLVDYARQFLTAGAPPSASEMRGAIRQLVREYFSRRLAVPSMVRWTPPNLLRGHDTLSAFVMHGQMVLGAMRPGSSSFNLGLDQGTLGVTRVAMVMITEDMGPTEDRFDPVGFRWEHSRPLDLEFVAWGFVRGRRYEAEATRPLGSTGPWSTGLYGIYRAGEMFSSPESRLRATALLDDRRMPRHEYTPAREVRLLEDAVVTLHRSEEQSPHLKDAFAQVVQLLPDGNAANPGREPNSRLR